MSSAQMVLGAAGDVLDASEVDRDLFIGSRPPVNRTVQVEGFQVLVLCAKEIQPRSAEYGFKGTRMLVIHAPLNDAEPTGLEVETALAAASDVAKYVGNGEKTLVTCAAGLNRSALVVALALLRLRPNLTPDEIIERIRRRRAPMALNNPYFVELIRDMHGARR